MITAVAVEIKRKANKTGNEVPAPDIEAPG